MLLSNRLFFEQVEQMLAEGHEVQIRMKGHSMRPLLRNERDIAVLTPIANYAGESTSQRPSPTTDTLQANNTTVPAAPNDTNHTLRSNADNEPNVQSGHDLPHGTGHNAPHTAQRHSGHGTDALQANNDSVPDSENDTSPTLRSRADGEPNVQSGHDVPHGTCDNAPHTERRHARYGTDALRAGDTVLFRCEGRHILHRIIRRDAERFTLAGDGNYRMEEHCTATDIVAVMTAVIRPSGRIVRTASRRWRRQSRWWLALPAGVRRFILRALWQLGVR